MSKKNSVHHAPENSVRKPSRTHHLEGGQRVPGKTHKYAEHGKPLLSIITVVFNGEKYLEQTLQSVLNQTCNNIEHIIIDGGSTDGTLDIVRKYEDKIAYWLSEPDNGIYDAMNKGIKLAAGEWINFLNAGDTFYQPSTIEEIFKSAYGSADLIYGDNEIRYNHDFSVIRQAADTRDLWKGIIVNHQSLFVKTHLIKKHPFNLTYKIGADYDFIYSAYANKYRFYKIKTVVASTAHGGFSDRNVIANIKEQWGISRKYNQSFKVHAYYTLLVLFAFLKNIIKKIFSAKMKEFVIKWKYK